MRFILILSLGFLANTATAQIGADPAIENQYYSDSETDSLSKLSIQSLPVGSRIEAPKNQIIFNTNEGCSAVIELNENYTCYACIEKSKPAPIIIKSATVTGTGSYDYNVSKEVIPMKTDKGTDFKLLCSTMMVGNFVKWMKNLGVTVKVKKIDEAQLRKSTPTQAPPENNGSQGVSKIESKKSKRTPASKGK